MPETATNPAPPPPPLAAGDLSRESFDGLVNVVQTLATLADMTQEGARVPVPPELDQALQNAGRIFVSVDHNLDRLPDEQVLGWAARGAQIAAAAATMVVNALAVLHDRTTAAAAGPVIVGLDGVTPAAAAPTLVGLDGQPLTPRPRRAEEVAQLPPHLRHVVRDHAAGTLHTFEISKLPSGLHRVVCHTCSLALGEVRDVETAEQIAATHSRGGRAAELIVPAREQVRWIHPEVPDPTGGPYDVPTCKGAAKR